MVSNVMQQNVVEANRERHLYLSDWDNVWFVPKDWCDAWSVATGFTGGLDYINEDGEHRPEIMCYAPVFTTKDSEVETMFCEVARLQQLNEVSEAEAKEIHPNLFKLLDEIDKE